MARTTIERDVREALGDLRQASEDLRAYGESVEGFLEQYDRLLESHSGQWVAFYEGAVRVSGQSIEDVLRELDEAGLPRRRIHVRYMDPEPVSMIL